MNAEYFQHVVQVGEAYQGYSFKSVDRPSQNTLLYFSHDASPYLKSYYLKIFPNTPDEMGELPELKVQRELIVSRLIRETLGIHTSQSTYLGKDKSGYAAILLEEVRGVPFDTLMNGSNFSRDSLRAIAHEVGTYLSRIHGITAPYFGDVGDAGDKFPDWKDCFTQDTLRHLEFGLSLGVLHQAHVNYFTDRLTSPILTHCRVRPTLCHGDFAPQNIIINPDTQRIAGIVDFELAKYWIPGWDLTRVSAAFENSRENMDLSDAFHEGYASVGKMNKDDITIQVNYYKPFESLNYWIWQWNKPGFHGDIKRDILRVTGIPV